MAQMLPPAGLQGEDPLEMLLLGSPQWGVHRGHPPQPRYRWLQKRLELGFVLELGLRQQRLVALQTEGLTAELLVVEPPQELLQQQELRPLELKRLPGLEVRQLQLVLVLALELQLVEFLPLVALRLRELEPLKLEPALALEAPLLLWLLVELQE